VEGKQLLIQGYPFLASASNPASSCYQPQSISAPIFGEALVVGGHVKAHTQHGNQEAHAVVTFGGEG